MKRMIFVLALLVVSLSIPAVVVAEEHGEPPVEELEQQFYDLVYQETENAYQLRDYDSIDALEEDMNQVMAPELANYYLDLLFYEEDGIPYVVPTEGPFQLDMEAAYTLEQTGETEYRVTQSSVNALNEEFTLTIVYQYEDGNWYIADRIEAIDYSDNPGGEMPDTATVTPTMLLTGLILIGTGTICMARKRRLDIK